MPLPLYDGANHVLDQDSPEITRFIQETRDGMAVGGWELAVPEPGPDGNPFLFIFVGPTAEHRGSGLRLHMAASDGSAVPDTAQVLVESFYKTGSERQTIFAGEYGEFSAIANQEDPDASLSAQRRVESGEDYLVRVEVSAPEGGPVPGPDGGGLGVPHRLRQDLVDRVGVGNDGVSQEMGAIRESPLHMSVRVTPPQHRPSGFLPPQE